MAVSNMLKRYGIREVADVCFYEVPADEKTFTTPVLYLDTLKVSTIELTAEQAEARGGKGNAPLIIWDYGKEINVTLEDALFSMKSMSVMFGDSTIGSGGETVIKTFFPDSPNVVVNGDEQVEYTLNGTKYTSTAATKYTVNANGTTGSATGSKYDYITATFNTTDKQEIVISPETYPGVYYIVGDTYARDEMTGKDEFFQFIIPRAKIVSENTLTLEAEGDPTVFNMSLRVLRPRHGEMMKLVKYQLSPTAAG